MGLFSFEPTYEERRWKREQQYSLALKRLEVEATQAQVQAMQLENERKRVSIERERLEVGIAYQDLQQRRYLIESAALDVQLKQRDLEMLYPNQMGAYPVHLNPSPEWNPLYLPAANSKYVAPEPPPIAPKSFSELLRDGTINYAQSQNKIVLGYSQNEIRYGSWLDLYSCGIGGVSGSGKTTTVRFLLFQAVLAGSHLIMIDPHIGDPEESLAAQFTCFPHSHLFEPCGDVPTMVMERVHFLQKELAQRKAKGKKLPVIVIVIDEYNAVMRGEKVRNAVAGLLVAIAQEGRKFGIFAMLIGQRWSAQDVGGADVRTSLASTLSHRFTDIDQAKKLIGDGRQAHKCLSLPQGHYLFRDTDGVLAEMTTPNTLAEDGEEIQRMLTGGNAKSSNPRIVESSISTEPLKPISNQSETSSEKTPEAALEAIGARIIAMQAQKMTKPEIMKALWNVSPGAGARYSQANEEYARAVGAVYEKMKSHAIF